MKLVNRKPAYGISHLRDEDFSEAEVHNRIYNLAIVVNAVFFIVSVKKLVHSIIEVLRQSVSDSRSGVLC